MKILVYPFYTNPYQRLLYDALAIKTNSDIQFLLGKKTKVLSLKEFAKILFKLFSFRQGGFDVFHLHWIAFFLPKGHIVNLTISFLYSLTVISLIKLLGFRLVWTVHNLLPHERQTLNDVVIRNFLLKCSDQVIVHSEVVKQKIVELGISDQKIQVIPIGPYPVVNLKEIELKTIQREVGVNTDSFVFLFFGVIRENKGVIDLLNAFTTFVKSHGESQLIVAGQCYDQNLKNEILSYQTKLRSTLI